MKQLSIFFMLIFSFSIFFISCDSGSSSSSLSDEEVAGIAESVIGAGEMPKMFNSIYTLSDKATIERIYPGLIVTETTTSVTFTFNSVEMDSDNDGTADITINGAFTYAVVGETTTITYTAFSFITTEGNASISGSISVNSSSMSVDLTLSGTGYGSVIVTMEASMSNGTISTITEATINSTDYSNEFQAALADYDAD